MGGCVRLLSIPAYRETEEEHARIGSVPGADGSGGRQPFRHEGITTMKSIFALTIAAALLVPHTVLAARPANIANTTWTLQVNHDVATLFIDTQGGPGAPGASVCRHIRGDINGIAGIRGHYC